MSVVAGVWIAVLFNYEVTKDSRGWQMLINNFNFFIK